MDAADSRPPRDRRTWTVTPWATSGGRVLPSPGKVRIHASTTLTQVNLLGMAVVGEDYERLLDMVRGLSAAKGRTMALCDVAAFIHRERTPVSVLALLLAAIMRDSMDEVPGEV